MLNIDNSILYLQLIMDNYFVEIATRYKTVLKPKSCIRLKKIKKTTSTIFPIDIVRHALVVLYMYKFILVYSDVPREISTLSLYVLARLFDLFL